MVVDILAVEIENPRGRVSVFYFDRVHGSLELFCLPRRVAGQFNSESDKIGGETIFEVWHSFLVRAGCWPEASDYVIVCLTFRVIFFRPQATISILSFLGLAGAEKMAIEQPPIKSFNLAIPKFDG